MKTESKIKYQKDLLEEQLAKIMKHTEEIKETGIDTRGLLDWAKCIESGKEALEWVLAGDDYNEIVY